MLESGMEEAQQKTIKVEVASKADFDMFYSLLLPGAWRGKVAAKNVDVLLVISDYYQVGLSKSQDFYVNHKW